MEDSQQYLAYIGNSKIQTETTLNILCENQNKHVLQMTIPPNCSHYVRGKIIYSNLIEEGLPSFYAPWNYLFRKGISMYLWRNNSKQMQVVGLTHLSNNGPMLIIDLAVYKDSFYVNLNKVLASKYTLENAIVMHQKINPLMLVQFKAKTTSFQVFFQNNQKVVLQANSPIIEKYLGEGEEFFVYSGEIVAMSKSIIAEKGKKAMKFRGPGWVFLQTENQRRQVNFAGLFVVFLFYFIAGLFLFQ